MSSSMLGETLADPGTMVDTASSSVGFKSAKRQFLESIKIGDVVQAEVRFKDQFGAFMTIGSAGFGLLHISELPGDRPDREAFLREMRRGQQLTVQIISINWKKDRVGLSLVAGERDQFYSGLKEGSFVKGFVSRVSAIGAWANFGGITGFVHVSEMPGHSRAERDAHLAGIKRGDAIELVVYAVSRELKEARFSLRRVPMAKLTFATQVSGSCVQVRPDTVVLALEMGGYGYMPRVAKKRYKRGEILTGIVYSVDVNRNSVELD